MQEQITLILIGAGIALASGILTTIVSAGSTYVLDGRRSTKAKRAEICSIAGNIDAFI